MTSGLRASNQDVGYSYGVDSTLVVIEEDDQEDE